MPAILIKILRYLFLFQFILVSGLAVGFCAEPKKSPEPKKSTSKAKKSKKPVKIIDWADGAPTEIITPAGIATVPTRVATFRMSDPSETTDIQIVAFKHDATNVTWVGPKFAKYALVNETFLGFDAPDGFGRILLGVSNRLPSKVAADMSILTFCALYEEQNYPDNVMIFYQTVNIRSLFGTVFFAGNETSAVGGVPSTLVEAVTTGEELKLKIQGHTATDIAEISFGGPFSNIGILRASVKGKAVPIGFATSMASGR